MLHADVTWQTDRQANGQIWGGGGGGREREGRERETNVVQVLTKRELDKEYKTENI